MNRGGPLPTLLEKPEGVVEPFRVGVGVSEGCWRCGASGRGSEGLAGGLNWGLGARTPGPKDFEKLGIGGASGVYIGLSRVEALNLLPYEGVVGVGGSSAPAGDRFFARWTGRNMPEPETVVLK